MWKALYRPQILYRSACHDSLPDSNVHTVTITDADDCREESFDATHMVYVAQ